LHHFGVQPDPDPHQSENLDPNLYPRQSEKPYPDPDPHHSDADPQHCAKLYLFERVLTNNSIQRSQTSFSFLQLLKNANQTTPHSAAT
jgi:hypothetical protein